MICVSCHCTEEKACTVDGVPCAWFSTAPPLCTVCVDRAAELLVVGVRVRITFGRFKGKLGTIAHVPKLYPDRRHVRLYGVSHPEQQHISNLALEKS